MTRSELIAISSIYKPMRHAGGMDIDPKYFEQQLEGLELNFETEYQRGHEWTEYQRMSFLGHWLGGGPVPSMIVNIINRNMPGEQHHLLDGKQRLTSLGMFLRNEIPAHLEDSENGGPGILVYRRDTDGKFRTQHSVHLMFVCLSPLDAIEFYLRFNGGGTPHRPEHLAEVRAKRDAMRAEARAAAYRAAAPPKAQRKAASPKSSSGKRKK